MGKKTQIEHVMENSKQEVKKTIDMLLEAYPTKEGEELDIIMYIIKAKLHEVQLDVETMDFFDFYGKYLKGTLFLESEDFTNTEKEMIISESSLKERDRNLARSYWIEMKNEDLIAEELDIDRKTVRNNVGKISTILKRTAMFLYKNGVLKR